MKKDFSKVSPKMGIVGGSVVAYLVKCCRTNCKCSVGELHGPYFYRYWREKGKRYKQYIKREDVEAINLACTNYRKQHHQTKQLKTQQLAQWRRLKAQLKELSNNE